MKHETKKFEKWPWIVTLLFIFFITGSFTMAWIAIKNPPEQIQRIDEWK